MVMGRINTQFTRSTKHYADIVFNKNKFDIKCICGWKETVATRGTALIEARMHVTEWTTK